MELKDLDIFYIVDTETTGLSPESADVIEISAVKVQASGNGYHVLESFDTYINPEYPLPEAIVKFNEKNQTGICDELLAKAPLVTEAMQKFHDFVGDSPVIVGHNIRAFDIAFIDKAYHKGLNISFSPKGNVDTLVLCRNLVHSRRHNLGAMFELSEKKYSESCPAFHTSIADCFANLDVLQFLKDTYYPDVIYSIKEAPKPAQSTIDIGNTNLLEQYFAEELRRAVFPSEISVVMGDDSINGFTVLFDCINDRIDRTFSKASYNGKELDLMKQVESGLRYGNSLTAITVAKDPNGNIDVTAYADRGKGNIFSLFTESLPPIRYNNDILEVRFAMEKAEYKLVCYQLEKERSKERNKKITKGKEI